MAVLALAAAGSAVGGSVGFAGVGWLVGSFLGQMLFPSGAGGKLLYDARPTNQNGVSARGASSSPD